MYILTVFSVVSGQYCYNFSKSICYPCNNGDFCNQKMDRTKILRPPINFYIDYMHYANTNIMVIEELHMITYYSCNRTYLQVSPKSFYPKNRSFLTFSRNAAPILESINITTFQTCLETYCGRQSNNRLECHMGPYRNMFDFQFSSIVTLSCIENITYALIDSDNTPMVKLNWFFFNARNLVYVTLRLKQLKTFECNTFSFLELLRVLQLHVDFNVSSSDGYDCFFGHNQNLVLLDVEGKRTWNPCYHYDSYTLRTRKSITIVMVLILFTVPFVLSIIIYKFYKHYWRDNDNINNVSLFCNDIFV